MKDGRQVRVVLIAQAREEFERLNQIAGEQQARGIGNSEEIQLLKSIKQKIELLRQNAMFGENIPKSLIPKQLEVSNLFRIELTHFWRMLYTLKGDEIEIVAFALYIVDHEAYNKIFGYKGR
jgi:predicted RNA-binding protein with EMAP domain